VTERPQFGVDERHTVVLARGKVALPLSQEGHDCRALLLGRQGYASPFLTLSCCFLSRSISRWSCLT
jgi:hypothetical protein